jgi:hypothetical protein
VKVYEVRLQIRVRHPPRFFTRHRSPYS